MTSRFLALLIAASVCGCAGRTVPSPDPQARRAPGELDPRLIGVDTMVGGSRAYVETEVDRPALGLPGPPHPHYPEELKSRGVQGRVEFRFVVDSAGRVEVGTISLLSGHTTFARAVMEVLPWMRFRPAERGGRRVRMWTVQVFEFRLGL